MILQSGLKRKTETIIPTSWFRNHNMPDVQSIVQTLLSTYCRLLKTAYRSNSITKLFFKNILQRSRTSFSSPSSPYATRSCAINFPWLILSFYFCCHPFSSMQWSVHNALTQFYRFPFSGESPQSLYPCLQSPMDTTIIFTDTQCNSDGNSFTNRLTRSGRYRYVNFYTTQC